jgi:hypothetical protein
MDEMLKIQKKGTKRKTMATQQSQVGKIKPPGSTIKKETIKSPSTTLLIS